MAGLELFRWQHGGSKFSVPYAERMLSLTGSAPVPTLEGAGKEYGAEYLEWYIWRGLLKKNSCLFSDTVHIDVRDPEFTRVIVGEWARILQDAEDRRRPVKVVFGHQQAGGEEFWGHIMDEPVVCDALRRIISSSCNIAEIVKSTSGDMLRQLAKEEILPRTLSYGQWDLFRFSVFQDCKTRGSEELLLEKLKAVDYFAKADQNPATPYDMGAIRAFAGEAFNRKCFGVAAHLRSIIIM